MDKHINEPSQDYIFQGWRNIADPIVRMAFDAADSFHDAYIDSCTISGDVWIIRIKNVYFFERKTYNAFATNGAELRISMAPDTPEEKVEMTGEFNDRSIYSIDYDLDSKKINVSVQLIYDFSLEFVVSKTKFSWIFT